MSRKRAAPSYPHTPDGRYFIVSSRLWRLTNPNLSARVRENWVSKLMKARRQVGAAGQDSALRAAARRNVDLAKCALGERGEPWWSDGAPDYNRRLIAHTPYAAWFASSAIEAAIMTLLTERDGDASTCPSEIARALAPSSEKQWRSLMPLVRKAASKLAREQRVRITRGAETLGPNDLTGGPIRIRQLKATADAINARRLLANSYSFTSSGVTVARKYSKAASRKVKKVMKERKSGTLKSGRSGRKVKSRKQAIAIGLSEARKAGKKVPKKKKKTASRRK